jgi:hypothetical protein
MSIHLYRSREHILECRELRLRHLIAESVRTVPVAGQRRPILRRYSHILIFTGFSGLRARSTKRILDPDRPDASVLIEKGGAPAGIVKDIAPMGAIESGG